MISSSVSYVGKSYYPIQFTKYLNLDQFRSRLSEETVIRPVKFSIIAKDEEAKYCCLNCLLAGHVNKKWTSDSTPCILQSLQKVREKQ